MFKMQKTSQRRNVSNTSHDLRLTKTIYNCIKNKNKRNSSYMHKMQQDNNSFKLVIEYQSITILKLNPKNSIKNKIFCWNHKISLLISIFSLVASIWIYFQPYCGVF